MEHQPFHGSKKNHPEWKETNIERTHFPLLWFPYTPIPTAVLEWAKRVPKHRVFGALGIMEGQILGVLFRPEVIPW